MSNINLTCDVCGREVRGYTWVNGMRFCAKCYQETFDNKITTDMLLDMIKNAGWNVDGVGVLKNIDAEATIMRQEKQITDLEAKLAEMGKEIAIRNQKLNELKTELHKRDESLQRKKQQVEDVHKAVRQAKREIAKKGREVCKANNEVVQYKKQIRLLNERNNQEKIDLLRNIKNYFCIECKDADGIETGDWEITKDACDVAEYIDVKLAELTHQHEDKGE